MRFTVKSSRYPLRGPILFALFLLAILGLSAAEWARRDSMVEARKATNELTGGASYVTGSIVIPAAGTKFCRRLQFNNATGEIRELDTGECLDLAPSINSTEGRIGAIRRSFAKGAAE